MRPPRPRVNVGGMIRSRRLRALAPLLILLLGLSCALAPAAGAAGSTPPPRGGSASPFKSSTDSGILYDWSAYESDASFPSGCTGSACYSGWDACTYTQDIGSFNQDLQQYTVPGCVPVQTPWIETKASTTQGWALYCPTSAPYAWDLGYPGNQGQADEFWNDGTGWMKNLAQVPGNNRNGPNPVGKADWSMHNWSAIHSHHWGYIIGCSTISNSSNAAEQQPPYSHGQGTSACPHGWPIPGNSCSTGLGVGGPGAGIVKGPAHRVTRTGARSYSVTREVDLRRGRVATYALSCRAGYRRVLRHWAVGWYTRTAPSRRQGRAQARVASEGTRSLAVRVRTNDRVRPGTARLQLALSCRR